VRQEDANLDPKDGAMLRATLERMVEVERGSLRLDLSEWSLVVHGLGGGMIMGSSPGSAVWRDGSSSLTSDLRRVSYRGSSRAAAPWCSPARKSYSIWAATTGHCQGFGVDAF